MTSDLLLSFVKPHLKHVGQRKIGKIFRYLSNFRMLTLVRPTGVSEIPLTKGQVAIVDTCLLEYLNQWKWHASNSGKKNTIMYYARRSEYIKGGETRGQTKHITLHRQIFLWCELKAETVDHINGDKLDNRLINFRAATRSQNSRNIQKYRNNTSGYKGVYWRGDKKKWQSRISINNKPFQLGYFRTPEEAALAYNKAAYDHYGDFACLNELMTP